MKVKNTHYVEWANHRVEGSWTACLKLYSLLYETYPTSHPQMGRVEI